MRQRIGLAGLIALSAFPLPGRGEDVDLLDVKTIELVADIQRLDVETPAGAAKDEVFGDEKLIKEFVDKATAARRKQIEKEIEKVSEDLLKNLNADAALKERIGNLKKPVIDAAIASWEEKCREWTQNVIIENGDAEVLKNWQPEQIAASNNQFVAGTPPDETAAWRDGVKQALTLEQWSALEEQERVRLEKLRKEFADYLSSSEAQAGEVMTTGMDSVLNRIFLHEGIDEARREKLKRAADEAVKVTLAAWRVRAERQLLKMDDKAREQIMQRNGLMGVNTTDKANQPREQTAWKDALAQILTDEERAKVEERRRSSRSLRAEAFARVLIADLDRLVGFQEKQRDGLLKLMVKPLEGLPAHYFEPSDPNTFYSIDLPQVYRQIRSIKEEQVSALLDEKQMKRWREITPAQLSRNQGYVRERMDTGDLPPASEMDEVEVERVLSAFFHREARKMKKKMQVLMESQVESISRVANPAPETVSVLNTAAKGAAEEMAMNSINNLTSWLRAQIQSLKPSDVPARLQNLHNPYFHDRQAPVEPRLWTAVVERQLSAPQREAWKAECAARDAWRFRGISAMVLTDLEKRLPLKLAQREALDKKLTVVIADYEPEFANCFSHGWHLQGYYSLVPIAVLTDKEMAEFFDKKEIETLKEKCLGNALQYAEMLRRNHASRTKR